MALETRVVDGPRWELRSFEEIKRHLSGFEDKEPRQILISGGTPASRAGDRMGHFSGSSH